MPQKTMKSNISIIILMSLLILAFIFNSGCVEDGKSKTLIMTMKEFAVDDIEQDINYDSKLQTFYFKSLDEGDTVIIIDTIHNLTFVPYQEDVNMSNITELVCESVYEANPEQITQVIMPFEGDLTTKFKVGDKIKITLHIITDTYVTERHGTIWTFKLETTREGWDSKKHEMHPLPQSAIDFA